VRLPAPKSGFGQFNHPILMADEIQASVEDKPIDRSYGTGPPPENTSDLADLQSRHGAVPRFAGKGREIAAGCAGGGATRSSFAAPAAKAAAIVLTKERDRIEVFTVWIGRHRCTSAGDGCAERPALQTSMRRPRRTRCIVNG
jgi:hypothetical protein